ncbi:unnamed protein product, partial [Heterotrigona itama]
GFGRRSPDVWRWPYKHATCNYARRGICMQMGKRLAARFVARILIPISRFNKGVHATEIIGDINKVHGKNVVKIRKPFLDIGSRDPEMGIQGSRERCLNALQDSITNSLQQRRRSIIKCHKLYQKVGEGRSRVFRRAGRACAKAV